MDMELTNYTPLDTSKLGRKKKKLEFQVNKALLGTMFFLVVGIGMVGYMLILRKPIRKAVPAYLTGEATSCNIKVGPPIAGSDKVEGNKYMIQVPVENKNDNRKRVKISKSWYACNANDRQTCTDGNDHSQIEEFVLRPGEKRIITVEAQQSEGACGSLQIDVRLKAAKNAGDDGGDDNNEEGWNENCNTNSTWVGGFHAFSQVCGEPPTNTPAPSNTPTLTPTGTPFTPTPTITPTGAITPTDEPTSTPTKTSTPTLTPTLTLTPTRTPTTPPGQPTNTRAPTATPIPVACGTKSCDNTVNPCRSGLECVQANDGSNYCSLPEFVDACKENPSQQSCCTAPGNATPTEIVLVNTTAAPGGGSGSTGGSAAQTTEIPAAGIATFGKIFAVISAAIIVLGLIL